MRVEMREVVFSYASEQKLLDRANLHINSGEVVAIMGPSGVGKSTLLSLMGGLLSPDSGTITWDGQRPDARRADLLTWVLQTVNAIGHRSALDNVMLGLYARGMSWKEARPRAMETLDRVGLRHFAHRRVNDLSGGEIQRMVIARALAGSPSLVLADEPTAQLDAANAKVAIDRLVNARAPTTSVIFATHDPLVASSSHRVLVLRGGTIHEGHE